MSELEIKHVRYGAPVARRLVEAALAELAGRYGGPGDETPVDATEFDPPDGVFLIAWRNGEAVGCGGWRTADGFEDAAEIKRMYVAPAARGLGVARALLAALEESARQAGMKRVLLETGDRQPEAIALYERVGYERIPNFGHYRAEPGCVSFGRSL